MSQWPDLACTSRLKPWHRPRVFGTTGPGLPMGLRLISTKKPSLRRRTHRPQWTEGKIWKCKVAEIRKSACDIFLLDLSLVDTICPKLFYQKKASISYILDIRSKTHGEKNSNSKKLWTQFFPKKLKIPAFFFEISKDNFCAAKNPLKI